MSFSVKSKNPHGCRILQNVQKDGTRAYFHNVFSTFSEWAFCTLGPFCGIVTSAKKGKIFLFFVYCHYTRQIVLYGALFHVELSEKV